MADEDDKPALHDPRSYQSAGGGEDVDTPDSHKTDDKKGGDKKGGDKKGGDKTGENKKGDDTFEKPKPLWPWLVAGLMALVFVAIVLAMIFAPHPRVRTNDAYVMAHYAMISPRVSGHVVDVEARDNQPVRAGQLLVALDPADYQAALDRALAQQAQDEALVGQAQAQVERQPALILQGQAQVQAAQAALALSRANTARYTNLAATGAGSVQQRQTSNAQRQQDEASLKSAVATLSAAVHQLQALKADRESAAAKVRSDAAEVEQARLNLSYTRILAPLDGMVDQKAVQVGDNVAPGAAMLAVVPLQAIYVQANYRELALRHILPGQPVRIHVDAYDIWVNGVVQGVPAASGAVFSPIPPNNATGNFTKIVQRLPVKIVFAPNQPLVRLLRVGMSVETVVDTGLHDVVAQQRHAHGWVNAP